MVQNSTGFLLRFKLLVGKNKKFEVVLEIQHDVLLTEIAYFVTWLMLFVIILQIFCPINDSEQAVKLMQIVVKVYRLVSRFASCDA